MSERTKFPTMQQYTNCKAPTTTRNAMKESSSLTRCGVLWRYLSHTPCRMSFALVELPVLDVDLDAGFAEVVVEVGFVSVEEADAGARAWMRDLGGILDSWSVWGNGGREEW